MNGLDASFFVWVVILIEFERTIFRNQTLLKKLRRRPNSLCGKKPNILTVITNTYFAGFETISEEKR